MKDLTKIYIDLSKCTEEERKHIVQILNATGKYILWSIDDAVDFLIHYNNRWCTTDENEDLKDKQELTYPEFIKLFEGGEGEIQVEHACKYCGCLTTQPDSECYAAPKNKMETLFEKLKYKIKECEAAGDDMNDESWNYQVGVLITGNDAKEILKHTSQLKADKAELLEALEEANLQIQYLHEKFNSTGSGNAIISKNKSLIEKHKQ